MNFLIFTEIFKYGTFFYEVDFNAHILNSQLLNIVLPCLFSYINAFY